jgi:hypothetical protein
MLCIVIVAPRLGPAPEADEPESPVIAVADAGPLPLMLTEVALPVVPDISAPGTSVPAFVVFTT